VFSDCDDTPAEEKAVKDFDYSVENRQSLLDFPIFVTHDSQVARLLEANNNRGDWCNHIGGKQHKPDGSILFDEFFWNRFALHCVLVASDNEQVPESQQAVGVVHE